MSKSTKVVKFPGGTTLGIPIENVLEGAKQAGLSDIIVVGWDENGDLYGASSFSDAGDLFWLWEMFKIYIFRLTESIPAMEREE